MANTKATRGRPKTKAKSQPKKKTVAKPEKDIYKKNMPKPPREKLSDIYTFSGVQLTVKEARFVDEYIKTGNASKSAEVAGYKGIPSCMGSGLLKKPYIHDEIQNRLHKAENNSIATRQEIMQFWTDMMRGKILDQFDLPTTNADKLKAATELAKRSMDIEDRINERKNGGVPEIKISLDWGGSNDQEE